MTSAMRSLPLLKPSLLAAAAVAALCGRASGQDSQYWTNQFGNEARLLSGAVIGSVGDLSAVYYNPGMLALTDHPELILAGNVVRYTTITYRDALGDGQDLSQTQFGGVPSLFAGEFRFPFLGKNRVAYSFLARQDLDLRFVERGVLEDVSLPGVSEQLDLFADLQFEMKMNEYWAGLTWARALGSSVGLGVTTFVAIRNQRWRSQTVAQAETTSGAAGIALRSRSYNYQNWQLLWKLGLGIDLTPWHLGLSVTTPGVKLFGSGSTALDESVVSEDLDQDGTSKSQIVTDFQTDVPSDWHHPLSVGVGAAYEFGETRLYGSAEWFNSTGRVVVMDTEPVATPDSVLSSDVIQEFDEVLNFAVGANHTFSERVAGYAGFRTDFTASIPISDENTSVSIWDIYHVSTGATFTVARTSFTLGGIFSFGSEPTRTGIELLPDGTEGEPILPQQVDTDFFRFTFILGFTLALEPRR